MNLTKQELEEEYVALENTRCAFGTTFRTLEQLFNELVVTRRNHLTSFDSHTQFFGVFIRPYLDTNVVHIFNFSHSMKPVISISKVGSETTIHIKKTVLQENNDYFSSAKRMLNTMIVKG